MPIDQRLDDACSLLFDSPPLTEKVELLGQPNAVLHVSSTAEIAYFYVRLCDVAEDGTSRLITEGGLLATHRDSHEVPTALTPGDVYELRIPLRDCAYVLEPGHRLRVAVASANFQNAWPTGQHAINTIYRGGDSASHVVLPIAPVDPHPLPQPLFAPSPHPLPLADPLARPDYKIELDLVNDAVSCELRTANGGRTSNHSRYTVSNCNPARAVVNASATHRAVHPTLDIRVDAHCQTTSDETSYTHMSQVRITVDGAEHFKKSWSETVPRRLS
jgi:hypothetical protein